MMHMPYHTNTTSYRNTSSSAELSSPSWASTPGNDSSHDTSAQNSSVGWQDPFSVNSGIDWSNGLTGVALTIFTVFPNLFVVIFLITSGRFRKPSDWLVLTICTINAPASLVASTIALTKYFTGVYPGREPVCHIQAFVMTFRNSTNLLAIVALSAERCLAVTKPFFYSAKIRHNRSAVLLTIAFIVVLSSFYALLPHLIPQSMKVNVNYSFCSPRWQNSYNRTISRVTVALAFLLLTIIVFLDGQTVREVWRMHRAFVRHRCTRPARSRRDGEAATSRPPFCSADRTSIPQGIVSRRTTRAVIRRPTRPFLRRRSRGSDFGREIRHDEAGNTRMVVMVSLLYVACFLPTVVRIVREYTTGRFNKNFAVYSKRLQAVTIGANPFLFCLLRRTYRQELQQLIRGWFRCLRRRQSEPKGTIRRSRPRPSLPSERASNDHVHFSISQSWRSDAVNLRETKGPTASSVSCCLNELTGIRFAAEGDVVSANVATSSTLDSASISADRLRTVWTRRDIQRVRHSELLETDSCRSNNELYDIAEV